MVVVAAAAAGTAILAQADITTGASLFNGDDAIVLRSGGAGGTIVDSFGQIGVDPGTEWGTGLTSTADNTLRRLGSVTAGDTDPTDAFDPATQWAGFATDTFDGLGAHTLDTGGPVDQPAVLSCGAPLVTSSGVAAERVVTATDPDDTIVDLDITSITPASRLDHHDSSHPGARGRRPGQRNRRGRLRCCKWLLRGDDDLDGCWRCNSGLRVDGAGERHPHRR